MHMKTLYASLMAAGMLVVTGCNVSSTGGKPGESASSFTLKGPGNTPETSVKQGGSVSKDLSIDAEKNFKESIALAVTVEPGDKGVTAAVEPTTWKASDGKKVELTIKASDKAAKGEYTIHVKGTPAKGNPTSVDVKIKVTEK